ncbi:MAG: hypothetical protein ABSF44_10520 [Candidatus Bathyarchaeia archaeon]
MAEFTVKVNPEQHLAYIPKGIYKVLGPKLTAVTGRAAVVFYSEETPIEDVIRSLEIIRTDLQHALHLKSPG